MAAVAPTRARSPRAGGDTTPAGPGRHAVAALVALHVAWGLLGAAVLALPVPARGWGVLAAVGVYVVALPLLARAVRRPDWVLAWSVALAVSLFQLLPDWALVEITGTLRFPDLGGPRVGDAIPLAMCGMWTAPLFLTIVLSRGRPLAAAGVALVLFAGTELLAPTLGLWEPAGATTRVAGVALYVLPAEAALGAATVVAWRWAAPRPWPHRLLAGATVATFYAGALVTCLLLIDGARLTLGV